MRWVLPPIVALSATLAAAQTPPALEIAPHDAAFEVQPDGETWLVLRYLAPAIAGRALSYDAVLPTLDHLCESEGLPAIADSETAVARVLIVLMDRPVVRGTPDPDATQYIGDYAVGEGRCQWE